VCVFALLPEARRRSLCVCGSLLTRRPGACIMGHGLLLSPG
jgi:hypothetical protein